MPRVFPTQLVSFIAEKFPWAAHHGAPPATPMVIVKPAFVALTRLIKEIPSELIQVMPVEYVELEEAISSLELAIVERGAVHLRGMDIQAVRCVYRTLQKCPDQYPSPAATDPAFITDPDLRADLHRDVSEVERALQNGEWKAATVLAGSVIEALLLWGCQEGKPPAELKRVATALSIRKRVDQWGLVELVPLAHDLGLITASTRNAANLAREFRNLIHPGRAQRKAAKCNRATSLLSAGAIEAVIVDLSGSMPRRRRRRVP